MGGVFFQVEIYNVQVGKTYSVKINPRQIVTPHPSTGGQPYALVVTGSFEKDANLFPKAAPTVSTSSSQIVLGAKNRFTVQGQNFAAAGNTAKLTCGGSTQIPSVKISSSTQTLVTIEIGSSSWTCPGGSITGVITAGGGFSSAPTQVAVAVGANAITGGGTVIIGADGFAQVVPASASARDSVCGTFIDVESCSKIEFCLWDASSQKCYSEPTVSAGVVVLIVLIVLALIAACYVYFVGCFGVGGRGGGAGNYQSKEQPPVVAMTVSGAAGVPPPPKQKPAQVQRPLQAGWVSVVDKASGDTYFFNQSTGATTWERHLIEA
jgi:hypothetical protein